MATIRGEKMMKKKTPNSTAFIMQHNKYVFDTHAGWFRYLKKKKKKAILFIFKN